MADQKYDGVMWVRLPRPQSAKELKALGLQGAACFGGDTCIAATAMTADAGMVIQGDIESTLKAAGFAVRGDCFGGDTCIV